MCGIVGAVAERNIETILLDGLKRLEYRGYDSAGIAIINVDKELDRVRSVGKVKALEEALKSPSSPAKPASPILVGQPMARHPKEMHIL
jgi:glucosamine--fructose-6-phosphate aminotransferase (isomerizing)